MESRGLVIQDRDQATFDLRNIGYYRLCGYTYSWRVRKPGHREGIDTPAEEFVAGHTFEEAVALYSFDRRLRILLLDALERFEVACRVRVAYQIGKRGPLAYLSPEHLDPSSGKPAWRQTQEGEQAAILSLTRLEAFIERNQELFQSSSEPFAQHVQRRYEGTPPIWIAVELWDFGLLSHFYPLMQLEDRKFIADEFGCPTPKQMVSWIRTLNHLRNVCAHHSRLYRKSLVDKPSIRDLRRIPELAHTADLPDQRKSKVYPTLAIVLYLLKGIQPDSVWPRALKRLLESFPAVYGSSLSDYGFPEGWYDIPLWQTIDAVPPKRLEPEG